MNLEKVSGTQCMKDTFFNEKDDSVTYLFPQTMFLGFLLSRKTLLKAPRSLSEKHLNVLCTHWK